MWVCLVPGIKFTLLYTSMIYTHCDLRKDKQVQQVLFFFRVCTAGPGARLEYACSFLVCTRYAI